MKIGLKMNFKNSSFFVFEKSKLAICKAFLYMLTYLTGGFYGKRL